MRTELKYTPKLRCMFVGACQFGVFRYALRVCFGGITWVRKRIQAIAKYCSHPDRKHRLRKYFGSTKFRNQSANMFACELV